MESETMNSPVAAPDGRWVIQLIQASQGEQETSYIPYSIGLLQAYILRHAQDLRRYTFLPLQAGRDPVAQLLPRIAPADIYGFSVYAWNINYSLALAAAAKAARPQALILFGGPQVPDHAEAFLRAHPFIDLVVHGEGERVLLQVLDSLPAQDWSEIPGISWIDASGAFQHHPRGPRIVDLDEIPSPYLMGIFDSLLAQPGTIWVPLWETNRGCPFSCTFCDWGSATAVKLTRFGLERLRAEIDWFAARQIRIVNCCDANFGILPRDLEIADYLVETRERTGFPNNFFMQSAKNVTDRSYAVQKRIIDAGLHFTVTLALQSVSEPVLRHIKRENISLDTYRELQYRFRRDGVATYTDLLIGLPGETYETFVKGVCRVIDEGQHHWICFYSTYLLPNAEMAQPEYRQRFGLETVSVPYAEAWLPVRQEEPERLEMLIAAASYSREDWRRMRAFAWWVQILYFHHRLLQLPLLLLHEIGGLPWSTIFEFFSGGLFENPTEANSSATPMLSELKGFLDAKTARMIAGEQEHCVLPHLGRPCSVMLNHFVLVGLSQEPMALAFFADATVAIQRLVAAHGIQLPPGLLQESLELSRELFLSEYLKRPFALRGGYNLWAWYQALLRGESIALSSQPCRYLREDINAPIFEVRVEHALTEHR